MEVAGCNGSSHPINSIEVRDKSSIFIDSEINFLDEINENDYSSEKNEQIKEYCESFDPEITFKINNVCLPEGAKICRQLPVDQMIDPNVRYTEVEINIYWN